MVQSGIPAPMLHQPKRHAWLQLLNKKPSAWASEGGGSISDVEATMQDMQNKHVQEIVKMAHDLNIQHAKAMEVQRKEVEAKDMRIENIVATSLKIYEGLISYLDDFTVLQYANFFIYGFKFRTWCKFSE